MERLEGSLDDFLLKKILESLDDHLLLELRCLGTRLKRIDDILKARFCQKWKITGVSGSLPPSPTAFTTCRLGNFYRRHLVVSGENLSSIALKHGTDVSTLRRVNNIITDHTLMSRTEVYVPGKKERN
jgi:LysM domain